MDCVDYRELRPGQRVRITQQVRIGKRQWPVTVEGVIRDVQVLVTGLTVERGSDDVVTLATVHFRKDNGELSSIGVDEHTHIEVLADGAPTAPAAAAQAAATSSPGRSAGSNAPA